MGLAEEVRLYERLWEEPKKAARKISKKPALTEARKSVKRLTESRSDAKDVYTVYFKHDPSTAIFTGSAQDCDQFVKSNSSNAATQARGGFVVTMGGPARVAEKLTEATVDPVSRALENDCSAYDYIGEGLKKTIPELQRLHIPTDRRTLHGIMDMIVDLWLDNEEHGGNDPDGTLGSLRRQELSRTNLKEAVPTTIDWDYRDGWTYGTAPTEVYALMATKNSRSSSDPVFIYYDLNGIEGYFEAADDITDIDNEYSFYETVAQAEEAARAAYNQGEIAGWVGPIKIVKITNFNAAYYKPHKNTPKYSVVKAV